MNLIKRLLRRIFKHRGPFIAAEAVVLKSTLGRLCSIAHHAEVINTSVGTRTSIGRYTKTHDADIGGYCSISYNVTIGAKFHPVDRISGHAFTSRKRFGIVGENVPDELFRTSVGNDVWIGCGAIILFGIVVGDGAVI